MIGNMAKGNNDLILRDRLQFDVAASGDVTTVYGRLDLSDYVNAVEKKGLQVKQVKINPRNPNNNTGIFGPMVVPNSNADAYLKIVATTRAYETLTDVGIGSPDVFHIYERTNLSDVGTFTDTIHEFIADDLHPSGYTVVSDILIGIMAENMQGLSGLTLELDVMLIAEPTNVSQKDLTLLLTQGQDL